MELKNQKVTRQFTTDVDNENNQVVMSFASQTPYLRHSELGQYYQILKCQPQYVDTSRLDDGACQLLLDHNWERTVGVCKNYWFANKKLYATCKFSKSQFAQGIKRDVLDDIRRNVSIGYIVNDYKVVEAIDGIKTIEVTNWQPYELTICSVPADPTVGYKRNLEEADSEAENREETQMKHAKNNKTDTASELAEQRDLETKETNIDLENKDLDGEIVEEKSQEAEQVAEKTNEEKQLEQKTQQKEVCPECGKDPCQCEKKKSCGEEQPKKEEKQLEPTPVDQINPDELNIRALGDWTDNKELAEQFIAEKKSYQDFKQFIKTKDSKQSQNSIQEDNKMEKKYFSIAKAINNIRNHNFDPEDYENKVIAENKRNLGIKDANIVLTFNDIDYNARTRAFSGTLAGQGYANGGDVLIQPQYLPQNYVTNLRPQLTLDKTGYFGLSSPDGRPLEWPVCTGGMQAGMYDLDNKLSASDMQFTMKTLRPRKAGAFTIVPYSLLLQSDPKADAKIEADMIAALYQIRDEQVFVGNPAGGNANEVKGIIYTDGLNEVSGALSAGWTWRMMLQAENEIRKKNVFSENLAFVMNGDTYVDLCSTAKSPGNMVAGFICENDRIKNFPVYVNNSIPSATILLGDFNQVVVTDFDGLSIMVDPYTEMDSQAIKIAGWMCFDACVQRPQAFTKITLQ